MNRTFLELCTNMEYYQTIADKFSEIDDIPLWYNSFVKGDTCIVERCVGKSTSVSFVEVFALASVINRGIYVSWPNSITWQTIENPNFIAQPRNCFC